MYFKHLIINTYVVKHVFLRNLQKIWEGRVYTLLYYIWQCLAFKPWGSKAIEGNQKQKKVQNLMQDMQARTNSLNDNV